MVIYVTLKPSCSVFFYVYQEIKVWRFCSLEERNLNKVKVEQKKKFLHWHDGFKAMEANNKGQSKRMQVSKTVAFCSFFPHFLTPLIPFQGLISNICQQKQQKIN